MVAKIFSIKLHNLKEKIKMTVHILKILLAVHYYLEGTLILIKQVYLASLFKMKDNRPIFKAIRAIKT